MSKVGGSQPSAKRVGIAPLAAGGTQASAPVVSNGSTAQRTRLAQPGLTRPLRDMVNVKAGKHHNKREVERSEGLVPGDSGRTAAVQTKAGTGEMPSPIQNFDGVAAMCGCLPPDTNGDVGPNHYMQWVNLHFAVYTKTGTQVGATLPGNALWVGNPNAPVCAANNDGDPIVLYDQHSGRWLASQFSLPNYPNGPFYQCVAVSSSSDPSGTWCGYEYVVSANKLNDYPKFGVWPTQNAYMATINQFTEPGDGWGGVGILAFERDKMIACNPARMLYRDLFPVAPALWGGMLPADTDGPTLPPANAPAPLIEVDDNAWDPPNFPVDRLDVWNATADWSGAGSMTVTREGALPTASFDGILCGFGSCVPQPGTAQRLATLGDRLMYRMAYRNFGSHQKMVVNHTVDVGSDRAGIRWYELMKTTGNWSISQQSTYAPGDGLHRWMGSAAMDQQGNMAMGFSIGNGTAPELRQHQVRGPARNRSSEHAPAGRRAAPRRHRLADPLGRTLGRLLDALDRSGRRLHVLVHAGIRTDDWVGAVEDADRLVQVPDLRHRWASTAATSASTTTSATTATTASASTGMRWADHDPRLGRGIAVPGNLRDLRTGHEHHRRQHLDRWHRAHVPG